MIISRCYKQKRDAFYAFEGKGKVIDPQDPPAVARLPILLSNDNVNANGTAKSEL